MKAHALGGAEQMRAIDQDLKLSQIETELLYQIHFEKKKSVATNKLKPNQRIRAQLASFS